MKVSTTLSVRYTVLSTQSRNILSVVGTHRLLTGVVQCFHHYVDIHIRIVHQLMETLKYT